MTNNVSSGGPAFPVPMFSIGHARYESQQQGLSLRDYFAAKAMQADISSGAHRDDFNCVAERAYDMADAMLTVRKQ